MFFNLSLKRLTYYVLFLGTLLSGCTPSYVPSRVSTPMLKNKGQIHASIGQGTSGFTPQVAYAVGDNIGVMLNGSFLNRSVDKEISDSVVTDVSKHNYVELGLGYFTKLGTRGLFDIYGGVSRGNMHYTDTDEGLFSEEWSTETLDIVNSRFFLQPSIGLTSKNFDFNLANRITLNHFGASANRRSNVYIEPTVTMKYGIEKVKFLSQVGISKAIRESDYFPVIFNVGAQLELFTRN